MLSIPEELYGMLREEFQIMTAKEMNKTVLINKLIKQTGEFKV